MAEDITECDECGDPTGPLYLHSRCHPTLPTWAIVHQESNEIEIVCAECETPIVRLPLEAPAEK